MKKLSLFFCIVLCSFLLFLPQNTVHATEMQDHTLSTESSTESSTELSTESSTESTETTSETASEENVALASGYTGFGYGSDGELRYYKDGTMVTNQFVTDGTYTFFMQADGSPMKNRLTYHPDGTHLIYFDENGHELFDTFKYCQDVGYTCYFNTYGYAYFDQITFVGDNVYYLDATGKMQQDGWFQFANGVDYGYANSDGTLRKNGFGEDTLGRTVFYHWNGMVARGLITDGTWYYQMDETDGHLLGKFQTPYKYLAIGNSLTVHPIVAGLWWGNWGMAASNSSNDYYHKVCSYLTEQHSNFSSNAMYFKQWETSTDRASQLSALDPYLSSDLNLISIQLGDNITSGYNTVESDYKTLVAYIKERAPNARIIIVDEFCWPNQTIESGQINTCVADGLPYVSLSAISGDPTYRVGKGTQVYGSDGALHSIDNDAVAAHPNDKAHAYMAQQIINAINP